MVLKLLHTTLTKKQLLARESNLEKQNKNKTIKRQKTLVASLMLSVNTSSQGRVWPLTPHSSIHFGKCEPKTSRNGWHSCSLPPWVVGMLSVTILLLAGRGSLAVRTWPATVTGLPAIWKVCSVVVMLLATVATEPAEAARHTMPPAVTCTHKGHHNSQSTAVVSTVRFQSTKGLMLWKFAIKMC